MRFYRAKAGLGEPATRATWDAEARAWRCHCGGVICATRGATGGAIVQCPKCGDWWRSRGGHGWQRMIVEDDV